MPLYDCMLLVKPKVKKEEVMQLMARVGRGVFQRNGVITDLKSFGKVPLAYGIKKLDGRHFEVIPFPMLERQSKWWAATLLGRIELPSEEEMIEDVKADYEKVEMKGWPKRYTHNLDFQFVSAFRSTKITRNLSDRKWQWRLVPGRKLRGFKRN